MSRARLAVVDDDEQFAEYLQVWLRSRGYEATTYHSGDALLTGTGGPLRVGLDGRLEGRIDARLKDADGGGQSFGGPVELRDGEAKFGPLGLGPSPRLY